jgi:hypothetical protein
MRQPAVGGCRRHAEAFSRFTDRQSPDRGEPCFVRDALRTPQALALGLGTPQASTDPLLNPRPLELGNRPQDMQLEPPGRGCGVDAFSERNERHAERVNLVQHQNQVPQVPPEAVETPDDQDVELPSLRRREHLVQSGSAVLAPRHTPVNIFDSRPPSRLGIPAQLLELVFNVLVERRNPGRISQRAFQLLSGLALFAWIAAADSARPLLKVATNR